MIPRHEIRLAQVATKAEISSLQKDAENQERVEYTEFDWNVKD